MKKISYLIIALFITASVGCSQQSSKNLAEMTFKGETTFDFGKIVERSDGSTEFIFKNTGKESLIITNVKSSCGCTVPTYPSEPVKKGDTAIIKVQYDTKRIGIFTKSITVYSNAKNSPVKLIIKGEVVKATK